MPSRTTVADFIASIERGEFLEALAKLHGKDMIAQENELPARIGRAAQLANEEAALKRMRFDCIMVQPIWSTRIASPFTTASR